MPYSINSFSNNIFYEFIEFSVQETVPINYLSVLKHSPRFNMDGIIRVGH